VYYATHRAREAGPVLAFANDRNATGRLELGHLEVSIPRDHRLAHVERPTWRTLWREDPARHFVILSRHLDSYDGFYARISGEVTASRRREVLVFIHGSNVAFDDALYRTAQITYDLGFDGPPILYSWPSNANLHRRTGQHRFNAVPVKVAGERARGRACDEGGVGPLDLEKRWRLCVLDRRNCHRATL
jgi:esterase/lipase superfamily enzyme